MKEFFGNNKKEQNSEVNNHIVYLQPHNDRWATSVLK